MSLAFVIRALGLRLKGVPVAEKTYFFKELYIYIYIYIETLVRNPKR